jgi:hypothetical protein
MTAPSNHFHDRLEKIINVFRSTHVFNRRRGCPYGGKNDSAEHVLSTWKRVWKKKHANCVSSMDELNDVQSTNPELYASSLNFYKEEIKIIHQEWDKQYPPQFFINYHSDTPIGTESQNNKEKMQIYAKQVGLIMFNNKFYGRNPRGVFVASDEAEYHRPQLIRDLSKERDDAIATFAEVLLSMETPTSP